MQQNYNWNEGWVGWFWCLPGDAEQQHFLNLFTSKTQPEGATKTPETHETTQEQYEKWSFLNGITLKSTVPAI